MKKYFGEKVEKSRVQLDSYPVTRYGNPFGLFSLKRQGNMYNIIISDGGGWDHVSVSLDKQRCPTWEEMCFVKGLFFEDEEAVFQLHPPKSDYVNICDRVLHLWRPHKGFPRPPKIMV